MKTTRDLRIEADQVDMGLALSPMIEAFNASGHPLGKCWNAFEDLCHELERGAIDRMQESPESSVMSRVVARLMGTTPGPLPLGAEDFARLQGYREALKAVKYAVAGYVAQAAKPKEEQTKTGLREMPRVGRSRL